MLYFAYGSDVHHDRMERLCPAARPLYAARVPHHVLAFSGRSEEWNGGTVTLELAPGRDLWGGVYEIDSTCRERLERLGAETGYVWCWTDVLDTEDERVKVGMLIRVREPDPGSPPDRYLDLLKEGWRQWGLRPDSMHWGRARG